MVAKILIVSNRKGGRAMDFIIYDFKLLVCVKFMTLEVEDIS